MTTDIKQKQIQAQENNVYDLFKGRTLHFYMILTRRCNLRCEFCYQPKSFRTMDEMPVLVADDTMDWIFDNFDEQNVKIMLWGGEPTLNFDVLEYLLEEYPQVRFTMVTNGYEINNTLADQLAGYSNNLYVSLSVANAKSKTPDYLKQLAPALRLVKATYGDVHYVSADPRNLYEDFVKLDEMGIPTIRMSIPRDVEINDADLATIEEEWKRIVDRVYFSGMFQRGKTNFDRGLQSNLVNAAKGLPLNPMQPYFCGCGYLYMSVDVNGDVYPCDWFCGLQELKYGSIYEGLIADNILKVKHMHDTKDILYANCKDCEIGDIRQCPRAMCLAENRQRTGVINQPQKSYCKANILEHRVHKYLVDRALKEGKI